MKTVSEICVYCIVGFLILLVVFSNRNEIVTPLSKDEIARDLPFAKEAEEAQWAYHKQQSKLKTA